MWTGSPKGSPVKEKAVAGSGRGRHHHVHRSGAQRAGSRADIDPQELRAVWVGSESHPYAVKPSGTVVAEAIGASNDIQAGDWEFACKAGTEAMVAAIALVGSGMGKYALAIGMDTAQGKPGDALEYTASSGGAAFIIGPLDEAVVEYRGHLFLCLRYARFLAPPGAEVPRARSALYRRSGVFQARRIRRPGDDGGAGHASLRFHLCCLPPAQSQIPA